MKWLRLPARRQSAPGAPARLDRSRLLFYLSSLAVLLLAFLIGLYAFLPISALRERIEREVSRATAGELRIGRLAVILPPALRAEDIVLRGVTGLPGRETVEIPALQLRPLWATLFGGNPGVAFEARLKEGSLTGTARQSGAVDLRAGGVAFSEPIAAGSALAVAGTLSQGSFTGALPVQPTTDTRLDLSVAALRVTGLEAIGAAGPLSLGTLSLQGTGKGNAFKVDRLEATGGDVQVTGSGSLLLHQPMQNSRVNLQLVLRPVANFDPNLRGLLDLFASAERDGSYRLRLTGTLASPVFAK